MASRQDPTAADIAYAQYSAAEKTRTVGGRIYHRIICKTPLPVPVVFFGLSAVRAGSLLHSALFVAGAVVCLVSGVVKVLWKGIAAVTRRNIWPMFVQMRVFMPAGFALIAAAGIGRRLLEYGAEHYGIREVTVNEQNPQAVGFYEHMGFVTYKRTDRDEQGGPYPLLYMRRA